MNYAKIYQNLVSRALHRQLDVYTEVHHIVPRCMGGGEEVGNLVRLTAEEHYLAHLLLVKIHPGESSLLYAANIMCYDSNGRRVNNKLFGWLRNKMAEDKKVNNPMKRKDIARRVAEVRRERGNLGRKSNPVSEEEKIALSVRMKAKNPCAGLPPWMNNRATPEALNVWRQADSYYEWWKSNQKGYCAMATAFGYKNWMSAHDNMVTKFKSGWIPKQDPQWLSFVGL